MLFTSSVTFNIDSCIAGATSFSWLINTCMEEKFWTFGGNSTNRLYRRREQNQISLQNAKHSRTCSQPEIIEWVHGGVCLARLKLNQSSKYQFTNQITKERQPYGRCYKLMDRGTLKTKTTKLVMMNFLY